MDTVLLPAALRALRLQSELDESSLAERIRGRLGSEMDVSAIERWEKGEEPPEVDELFALLAAQGLELRDLQLALEEERRRFTADEPDPLEAFVRASEERLEEDPHFRRKVAELVAGAGLNELLPKNERFADPEAGGDDVAHRRIPERLAPKEKTGQERTVKKKAVRVKAIDHLVLTVKDLATTCDFYSRVLGMEAVTFGEGRKALQFGLQKINLHPAGQEMPPVAERPVPGSADLCFLTDLPLDRVIEYLRAEDVDIEEGPVERAGACGPIRSIYLRDPDGNLLELANQL